MGDREAKEKESTAKEKQRKSRHGSQHGTSASSAENIISCIDFSVEPKQRATDSENNRQAVVLLTIQGEVFVIQQLHSAGV